MCGENVVEDVPATADVGSPPRVRGKLLESDFIDASAGITPACAGKTEEAYELANEDEDHPRVCGENISKTFYNQNEIGSPPRVRGKQEISK